MIIYLAGLMGSCGDSMDDKRRGLGLLDIALIGIILILGAFLIIESLFIVVNSDIFSNNPLQPSDKVAVIYVEGQMVTDGASGGGYVSSSDIIEELRDAQDDPGVKAIVLRIDSPGGSPVAAQDIYSQIMETKKAKPVVVSMGDMATSAAYYISSASDLIYAAPDSWTGNIGVIWPIENDSGHYAQEGIEYYVAKSGEYKDVGDGYTGLTDDEKTYVDGLVNETFHRFVQAVADGRNMSYDDVMNLSDGKVYTGITAQQLGLIDDIGTMYDAIDAAAALANISGTPDVTYVYPESLYDTAVAGSQANGTRTSGDYNPDNSPFGQMYA